MRKSGSHILQSIFNVSHPFWQRVEKVFSIFLLNICFVVTCLPILTYGIARLALFSSLYKLQAEGKIAVLSTYIGFVKRGWKKGLKLGLIEVLVVGICIFDLVLTRGVTLLPIQLLRMTCVALLVFSQLLSPYVYLLASQKNWPLAQIARLAFFLAGRQLGLTLIIMLSLFGLLSVALLNGLSLLLTVSAMALFGVASLAYLFIANCKTYDY